MNDGIINVPLGNIYANPYQPESRLTFSEDAVTKMAESIQLHGLMQIPVARKVNLAGGPYYEMGDGWLRLSGYRFLAELNKESHKYDTIPLVVRDLSDRQMADLVMEANTVRQDLNPIEMAKLYQRYTQDFGLTQTQLAKEHHCSQGEIANTIRLLDLPEEIQAKIISRDISETHGRQLLRLRAYPGRMKKMLQECELKHYSVDELTKRIHSEIFFSSRPLENTGDYNEHPDFDTAACKDCEHTDKLAGPYRDKKELRCLDQKCWTGKQKAVTAEKRADQLSELEKLGIPQFFLAKELPYGKFANLQSPLPADCKVCTKRGAREDEYSKKLFIVCLDKPCFDRKQVEERAAEELKRQEAAEQVEQEIDRAFENLQMPGKHIPLATIECLLRTREHSYNADKLLGKITDLFTTVPRKDKQNPTFKSVMALLRGMEEHELFYYVLPRLAFEIFRTDYSGRPDQVNWMLKIFQEGGKGQGAAPGKPDANNQETPGEASAPVVIPAGVRFAEAVPDEECKNCGLADEDHTIGHKFLVGNVSYKVCLKDYKAFEVKARLSEGGQRNKCSLAYPSAACREFNPGPSDHADPLDTLQIHTATKNKGSYRIELGKVSIEASTLKKCVWDLGSIVGWGKDEVDILQALNNLPPSNNKTLLIGIMEGKQPAEVKS